MKLEIKTGIFALLLFSYCCLFLVLPAFAMHLGNQRVGGILNVLGFCGWLGGWALFIELLHKPRQALPFVLVAAVAEAACYAASPAAHAFARAHALWYEVLCISFSGPLTTASYFLLGLLPQGRRAARPA